MLELDDFFFFQVPPAATGKVFFGEIGINHPIQPDHIIAQVLKNTSYDPVFATMDLDANFPLAAALYVAYGVGFNGAIFQFQSESDFIQVALCKVLV